MMIEVSTIEGGQKDILLKRTNIKKYLLFAILNFQNQNPNSGLSSAGSSGQRPRRPRRRQRPSSKNREENSPGNMPPGVKRRHSHGGVPVKRGSSCSQNVLIMTSLERLIRTHPIWFLPTLTRDDATQLLIGKEHGVSEI